MLNLGRGIAKINTALTNTRLSKMGIDELAGGLQLTFFNKKQMSLKMSSKMSSKMSLKMYKKTGLN